MIPLISHDPYQTLGVPRDADFSRIKNAHRALALKNHPDRDPELKHLDEFHMIQEAYEVLRDPIQRKQYDRQTLPKRTVHKTWPTNLPSKPLTRGLRSKPLTRIPNIRGSRHGPDAQNCRAREPVTRKTSKDFKRLRDFSRTDSISCIDSDSSSDSDSDLAARESRKQVQEGL